MAETFAETEVLIAIMDGDQARADTLLDGFLRTELVAFEDHVDELLSRIEQARRRHSRRAEQKARRG